MLKLLGGDREFAALNALPAAQLDGQDVISMQHGRCFCARGEQETTNKRLLRERIVSLEDAQALQYLTQWWCGALLAALAEQEHNCELTEITSKELLGLIRDEMELRVDKVRINVNQCKTVDAFRALAEKVRVCAATTVAEWVQSDAVVDTVALICALTWPCRIYICRCRGIVLCRVWAVQSWPSCASRAIKCLFTWCAMLWSSLAPRGVTVSAMNASVCSLRSAV